MRRLLVLILAMLPSATQRLAIETISYNNSMIDNDEFEINH